MERKRGKTEQPSQRGAWGEATMPGLEKSAVVEAAPQSDHMAMLQVRTRP